MSGSEQTIRDLLISIADELHYKKCHIELRPTCTNGTNFCSKLYEATISAPDKPDVELFAKFCIIGEETRALFKRDIYSREFLFYTEWMNIYRRLEEKHNIPRRDRLCLAKYYGCNNEYLKESIVLDNLLKKNFGVYERLKSVDWVHARESVKQLAILHASSITYAQECPQKFAEITNGLGFVYPKWYIEKFVHNALAVAKEDYRDRFSVFLKENLKDENYERFFKPGRIAVLIHGDFKPSNLMHRVLENGDLEVAILDFQTFRIGNPTTDLVYYIYNSTDEEFRRNHYHQLIDHYYEELGSALRRHDLDPEKIYSKQDFDYDLKKMLPYGLLIAIMVLPFVTVDPEDVPSIENTVEHEDTGLKPTALFAEMLNGIISDYIKMGVL
ncbi:unnamed protein product, partial [Iphiclides podalirius]